MITLADGSVRIVPVSPAMVRALELASAHTADTLRRASGGFWRGALPCNPNTDTVSTRTVRALVDRGIMQWSEWAQNRAGRYPVAAQIVKQQ